MDAKTKKDVIDNWKTTPESVRKRLLASKELTESEKRNLY